MKNSFVLIVALEDELRREVLSSHIPIIYSGIGKVNASIATFKAIQQYNPQLIINFGTVGKITPELSGLIQIGSVIQRDMIAEPLAPRGVVPFSRRPNKLSSISEGHICGTGDSFVTQQDDWLIKNHIDVVDMELFAIASVAHEHQINWLSYKYVSDEANESSGQDWSKGVNHGERLFLERLQAHL
jgi:adenosylhomocysteine nucleosidase